MTERQIETIIVSLTLFGIGLWQTGNATESLRKRSDHDSAMAKNVDFFAAIDAKLIEVAFIPTNATRAKVTVRNLTDQPLAIALPRAFAGIPVLGQFGFPGGQGIPAQGVGAQGVGNGGIGLGGPGGQLGAGGGSQTLGGGFNQGQIGGGGGIGLGNGGGGFGGAGIGGLNGGGGFFRVEPEKVRKLDVLTVCLEHGKPDPNARLKYRIAPLQEFTGDERIEALCMELAAGRVSQKVAQAAAWNIANGLSWDALLAKDRKISAYTGREKFFTKAELNAAMQLAAYCHDVSGNASTKLTSESVETGDLGKNRLNLR